MQHSYGSEPNYLGKDSNSPFSWEPASGNTLGITIRIIKFCKTEFHWVIDKINKDFLVDKSTNKKNQDEIQWVSTLYIRFKLPYIYWSQQKFNETQKVPYIICMLLEFSTYTDFKFVLREF